MLLLQEYQNIRPRRQRQAGAGRIGMMQMLKSMTGYGRCEGTVDGRHIVFEVKSVNHKYFECNARVARGCLFLEERLKAYLQEHIARGKVDVFLQVENLEAAGTQVEVNHALAGAYYDALRELKERYSLPGQLDLALLSRYSDIFTVRRAPEDEDALWQAVLQVAGPAVGSLLQMREEEGRRLEMDIREKAAGVLALVGQVEALAPQTVQQYQERLQARITELLGDSRFDEQRVLTEVAVFADKVAIDEETVRLRSHFGQLQGLLEAGGPAGRKIDFLVQEMNREVNTIGSKSMNSGIAHLVVDIKAEIEKIREQVQNVE